MFALSVNDLDYPSLLKNQNLLIKPIIATKNIQAPMITKADDNHNHAESAPNHITPIISHNLATNSPAPVTVHSSSGLVQSDT